MTKKETKQARTELKNWLNKWTLCTVQDGWPCATCTFSVLKQLGLKEDGEHNNPIDRFNEVWRGILQIREITKHLTNNI